MVELWVWSESEEDVWTVIINAILKEVETNPSRILDIIEQLLELFRANPDSFKLAINALVERMK